MREHSTGGPDERADPEPVGPCGQSLRRPCFDQRFELLAARAVPREKRLQWFRVRQVQPSFAGQQKLSPDGRHRVIDVDLRAGCARGLRSHQPGRTSTDNHDLHHEHAPRMVSVPNSTYSLTNPIVLL